MVKICGCELLSSICCFYIGRNKLDDIEFAHIKKLHSTSGHIDLAKCCASMCNRYHATDAKRKSTHIKMQPKLTIISNIRHVRLVEHYATKRYDNHTNQIFLRRCNGYRNYP